MSAETTLENNGKLIIFSDTHLKLEVEEKKYLFMEKTIKDADKVIINGDFWEGYKINFSQFIESPWRHLFPLLKKKKSIYLTGDHDKENQIDNRTSYFSDEQTERVNLKNKEDTFVVEHGNKWFKKNKLFENNTLINTYVGLETFLLRIFGKEVLKISRGRYNKTIKSQIPEKLKDNQILITGHTHVGEIDFKNRYLNSGIFGRGGFAQWLVLEKNKIPQLKEEWYDK